MVDLKSITVAPKGRPHNLPAPWVKWLTLWHRWAGVVLCLMFCVWFVTGSVMVFVPFPALAPADRDARSEVIPLDQVKLAPSQILATDKNADLHLIGVLGTPVYVRSAPHDITVRADTGAALAPLSPGQAGTIATHFAGVPVKSVSAPFDYDQWVVHQQFDHLRPFYRVRLDDPAHTELYVSRITGEVAQRTTGSERVLNWVGSVIHWIYITPVRKTFSLWDQLVWWISLAGLVLTIAGFVLGILRTSKSLKNVKRPRITPFRGWLEWHHKLGLFAGILVLFWIFSGWLSMDHGRLFSNGEMLPAGQALYQGSDLSTALADVTPKSLAKFPGATRLDFNSVAGHSIVAASGPKLYAPVDDDLILAGLRSVWKDATPAQLEHPSLTGTYALAEGLAGPVRLAHLSDPGHTDVYIDGATGRITVVMDRSRAAYAWVYYALHTWNFPWLATHPIVHNTLILLLLLAGFSFSLTSLIVAVKRLRLTFDT